MIAPIFEELLFRGWLLAGLLPHLGATRSIALSALLFALVHGDAAHMPGLFVLGSVLGWVYLRSGSLLAAMAVHVMWNLWVSIDLFANMA